MERLVKLRSPCSACLAGGDMGRGKGVGRRAQGARPYYLCNCQQVWTTLGLHFIVCKKKWVDESSEPRMTFSEMEKLKTLHFPQRKAGVLNLDAYWRQLGSSQNYPIPRPQPRMITKESERGGGRQASVLVKLSKLFWYVAKVEDHWLRGIL